jgi:hypothetical protein
VTPIHELVADYGPVLGLVGVSATLLVNGSREERRSRRDNHARAIQAVVAYAEMPYRIRRRRHDPDHRSAERARLSDAFSDIQAELASCEALIRADRDLEVRDAYEVLTKTLRATAGEVASDGWKTDPIDADTEMSMPDVYAALEPVRAEREKCEAVMAASTRPFWRSTST